MIKNVIFIHLFNNSIDLEAILINVWSTIVVAIVSSTSVLIATFISNRSNDKRLKIQAEIEKGKNKENLRLAKCESLYHSVLTWKTSVFKTHMDWILFVDGNINRDELLERALETQIKEEIRNMMVTIGIYFPSLSSELEVCQRKLKPANDIYFSAQEGRIKNRVEARNTILKTSSDFDDSIESFLRKISSIANF